MSDSRDWDQGNFSRTRLQGSWSSSLELANVRSGWPPIPIVLRENLLVWLGSYSRDKLAPAALVAKQLNLH